MPRTKRLPQRLLRKAKRMQAMERAVQNTVMKGMYEPRGAARELWLNKYPEILIEGPAGTGKTRAILEKIFALANKYPGSRHLLCRKTRASMTQSVLVTFEDKVLPEKSPLRLGANRQQRQSYKMENGSEIVVSGLDKPERTYSMEYDTVTVFEAIEVTEHEWESLHRALRKGKMPYTQAIADTNPGAPSHWLNKRADGKRMLRLLSRHEDNPVYFDADGNPTPDGEQYIKRLDSLTGVRHLRLRLGKWAQAEGVVYPNWDPTGAAGIGPHLIKPFRIPPDWPRIRAFDFGFTHPFVCQWWALDGDKRMYLYREIFRTGKLIEEHAKQVAFYSGDEEYETSVSDHDRQERGTLDAFGIPTVPAYKDIMTGCDAVGRRLNRAGDGRPRLFVFEDCLVERDLEWAEAGQPASTREEFESYAYMKKEDGSLSKDKPADEYNHGMDAMRYAVCYVDKVPFGFNLGPTHNSGYVGGATTADQ